MNEADFKEWLKGITQLMRYQNEPEDFIEYLSDWFCSSLKGKYEIELIKEYHPNFKKKSRELILKFIENARKADYLQGKDFELQIFNSAFFLYRPLLKCYYLEKLSQK